MLYDTALNNTEFSCATTMHGTMVGGESTIYEVQVAACIDIYLIVEFYKRGDI